MKQIARVSVGYYWLILAVYIKSYCKTSISLITMDRTNIILKNWIYNFQAAQNAQRDSQELFQYLYFKQKDLNNECCRADAIIFQIRANGLMVFVPRLTLNNNSSELTVDDFSIHVHVNQHCSKKKIIIFPLYRYGIRAPVYLRNKDGQVLYVQESGQSEWTGGSITKSEGSVSVNSLVGSMTLTLLDHITVSRIITLENGFFSHTCN